MIARRATIAALALALTACQVPARQYIDRDSRPGPASCIAGASADPDYGTVVITTSCFRADGTLIAEDDPEWDCTRMGNLRCGPVTP